VSFDLQRLAVRRLLHQRPLALALLVGLAAAVALAATEPTLEQARARVAGWAERVPVLEWRRDVGDGAYLEGLSAQLAAGAGA